MEFSRKDTNKRNESSIVDSRKKGNRKKKKRSAKQIERCRKYRERLTNMKHGNIDTCTEINPGQGKQNKTDTGINPCDKKQNKTDTGINPDVCCDQQVRLQSIVPPFQIPALFIPGATAMHQPFYFFSPGVIPPAHLAKNTNISPSNVWNAALFPSRLSDTSETRKQWEPIPHAHLVRNINISPSNIRKTALSGTDATIGQAPVQEIPRIPTEDSARTVDFLSAYERHSQDDIFEVIRTKIEQSNEDLAISNDRQSQEDTSEIIKVQNEKSNEDFVICNDRQSQKDTSEIIRTENKQSNKDFVISNDRQSQEDTSEIIRTENEQSNKDFVISNDRQSQEDTSEIIRTENEQSNEDLAISNDMQSQEDTSEIIRTENENDNDEKDDDIFGILAIYVNSDLHCALTTDANVENNSKEDKHFGYSYFCLANLL